MNTFEIIIALALVWGIGYVLYLILQDSVLLLKSLLRGLKNNDNWKTLIVFFPIWGSIWLVDKVFNLKYTSKTLKKHQDLNVSILKTLKSIY